MPAFRSAVVFLVLTLLTSFAAIAGAPELNEKCQDRGGKRVRAVYDPSKQFFAQARLIPSSERRSAEERGLSQYVIYVNPERYFLGRETQQWLYTRQCAHIVLEHPVVRQGERGLNLRDEVEADCWAVREMSSGRSQLSRSAIYSIERDMERVIRENRWSEVLPGPKRRINLSSCKR